MWAPNRFSCELIILQVQGFAYWAYAHSMKYFGFSILGKRYINSPVQGRPERAKRMTEGPL